MPSVSGAGLSTSGLEVLEARELCFFPLTLFGFWEVAVAGAMMECG